jgi:hypothetical protein
MACTIAFDHPAIAVADIEESRRPNERGMAAIATELERVLCS